MSSPSPTFLPARTENRRCQTGATTTTLISSRIVKEAKILLKQTDWNVSQIAWSPGFEEVAHFSNFFRKQTSVSPMSFRA